MKKRMFTMGLLLALLSIGVAQGIHIPLAHASGWACSNDPVLPSPSTSYGPFSNGHGMVYVQLKGQDCLDFFTSTWAVKGSMCLYNIGCLEPSNPTFLFIEQGLDHCNSTDPWFQEMTTGNDYESVGQSGTATGPFLDCGQYNHHAYNVLSSHTFQWDSQDSYHGGSFCGEPPNTMSTNTSGCSPIG